MRCHSCIETKDLVQNRCMVDAGAPSSAAMLHFHDSDNIDLLSAAYTDAR